MRSGFKCKILKDGCDFADKNGNCTEPTIALELNCQVRREKNKGVLALGLLMYIIGILVLYGGTIIAFVPKRGVIAGFWLATLFMGLVHFGGYLFWKN